MKTVNGKDYITANEVAAKSGCSPGHIRLLARQGKIPSIKIMGLVLFEPYVRETIIRPKQTGQRSSSVLD